MLKLDLKNGEIQLSNYWRVKRLPEVETATEQDLDRLLGELASANSQALVLLQSRLARCQSANLRRVQSEGGRIVIAEIPPLEAPAEFRSGIEEMLQTIMRTGVTTE